MECKIKSSFPPISDSLKNSKVKITRLAKGVPVGGSIEYLDDGTLLFFDNGNLSQMLLGDSFPTTRIRRIYA